MFKATCGTKLDHGVLAFRNSTFLVFKTGVLATTRGTKLDQASSVGLIHGGNVSLKDWTTDGEQVLMSALSQQPVSNAVKADQSSFQLFKTDGLTVTCSQQHTELHHDALAVVYGTGQLSRQVYSQQRAERSLAMQTWQGSLFVCSRQVCSQQCAERSLTMAPLRLVTAPKMIRTVGAGCDVGFESAARINRYQSRPVLFPSDHDRCAHKNVRHLMLDHGVFAVGHGHLAPEEST